MNQQMAALNLHLAALPPSPSGWLYLDRDKAAAAVGVGRIQLARLLTKAEKSLGIMVESERVRFLSDAQIDERNISCTRKTRGQLALETAISFWEKYGD